MKDIESLRMARWCGGHHPPQPRPRRQSRPASRRPAPRRLRLLFSFAGGSGHLEPLLPLATAARAAGHAVAFAARPWMLPKVEALGFAAFRAGSDTGLTPVRRPLAAVDVEGDIQGLGRGFGRRIARERAADLLPLCKAWQPDLVVCEETDFGALVVAEYLGLPYATVLVIAEGSFVRPDAIAGPLDEVRAEYGLLPDPTLAALGRYLVLSPFPPSFRNPAAPLPATAHGFRAMTSDADPGDAPAWLANLPDAPTVYLTLGTIYNVESGDLFQRALTGLRDLPINIIVTVGRDIDPAELGPQPAHVRIEGYVPQALLLPRCDLVVCHGGSGSTMGALAHGLPLVLLPLGADQPLNAARCETLGVGVALDVITATPHQIRDAAVAVLGDPGYRIAAERLRDEIAALPPPDEAMARLVRLAERKSPRFTP